MSRFAELQEALSEKVKGVYLLHLLINDLKFLLAAVILTPLAIGGIALIPKIWKVTPEGFSPIVRVSGLDFIQSYSLARTAREQVTAGKIEDALYSWEVAIANQPADQENLRGAIQTFLQHDDPTPKQVERNVRYSIWLLRVNQTNRTDLELVASTFDRVRLDRALEILLQDHQADLTENTRACYSRSLFNLGRYDAFQTQWEQLSESTREQQDNKLYGLAYQAIIGSNRPENAALRELIALGKEGEQIDLAQQLLLLIYYYRREPAPYREILADLQSREKDRYAQHITLWNLMATNNQIAQAIALSKAHEQGPENIFNLINHARFLRNFDSTLAAFDHYQTHLENFFPDPKLYAAYATLLIEMGRWNTLREAAIHLRTQNVTQDANAISYYLEGTADARQSRSNGARVAFEKFLKIASTEQTTFDLSMATQMVELGYPKQALELVRYIEPAQKTKPGYWYARAGIAFASNDYEEMKQASERAYELEPTNPHYKASVVESLLLLRQEPARIVALSLELTAEQPNNFAYHINHVLGLLLNERIEEAAERFRILNTEMAPDAIGRAAYQYAKFSIEFLQGNYSQAQESLKTLPLNLLSSHEREFIAECQKKLQ